MANVRFDDSLLVFVRYLEGEIGDELDRAVFLRDATGQLSVVLPTALAPERLSYLQDGANEALGGYARPDGSVRDLESPGADLLLCQTDDERIIPVRERKIRLIDRRIVGADWLLLPTAPAGIPRIAFASLKGGVGRSTALAVAASYLSIRGLRVLVVDLDLEAPGIGTMLIEEEAIPRFGTLDYLVENGISGIDDDFLEGFGADSFLGSTGGRVTVLPAIGTATTNNPSAALAKISRAYIEDIDAEGRILSLTSQIQEMIDRVTANGDYDAVLVDARAGLHETTAAALLGLGAEMLLFGVDEPQTYLGYKLLLSHLVNLGSRQNDDWRDRVQFVHAKSSADQSSQQMADTNFDDLFNIMYSVPAIEVEIEALDANDFDLVWADDDAPLEAMESFEPVLRILDDSRYNAFNPLSSRELLSSEVFSTTFGSLLNWLEGVFSQLQVIDDDN